MPFRSETEQLRETLRRTEETESELLEEKARLERQAAQEARGRTWMIFAVVASCVTGAAGYGCSSFMATSRWTEVREHREREQAEEEDRERTRSMECDVPRPSLKDAIAECELDHIGGAPPEPVVRPKTVARPPCRCAENDAHCDCPFDRDAAFEAIRAADSRVARCFAPDRAVKFRGKTTFDPPRGRVSTVTLEAADALDGAEKKCVESALSAITVAPFAGGPLTTGKTYFINTP